MSHWSPAHLGSIPPAPPAPSFSAGGNCEARSEETHSGPFPVPQHRKVCGQQPASAQASVVPLVNRRRCPGLAKVPMVLTFLGSILISSGRLPCGKPWPHRRPGVEPPYLLPPQDRPRPTFHSPTVEVPVAGQLSGQRPLQTHPVSGLPCSPGPPASMPRNKHPGRLSLCDPESPPLGWSLSSPAAALSASAAVDASLGSLRVDIGRDLCLFHCLPFLLTFFSNSPVPLLRSPLSLSCPHPVSRALSLLPVPALTDALPPFALGCPSAQPATPHPLALPES